MSVTNVAFYQKIKDLQDRQHEKLVYTYIQIRMEFCFCEFVC